MAVTSSPLVGRVKWANTLRGGLVSQQDASSNQAWSSLQLISRHCHGQGKLSQFCQEARSLLGFHSLPQAPNHQS